MKGSKINLYSLRLERSRNSKIRCIVVIGIYDSIPHSIFLGIAVEGSKKRQWLINGNQIRHHGMGGG
jgi:hypothetical protein